MRRGAADVTRNGHVVALSNHPWQGLCELNRSHRGQRDDQHDISMTPEERGKLDLCQGGSCG